MRHPFWKWTQWTSWLCVGLSGCLHGQDWRAAVSKPLTRPVADRRESLPQPKVIGPRRQQRTAFVPPTDSPASAAMVSPPVRTAAPIVSGPRVLSSKVSVPAVSHMTPSAIMARPPAFTATNMDGASRKAAEAIRPPTIRDEAQPRGVRVHEAGFIPPPVPPAAPPTIQIPFRRNVTLILWSRARQEAVRSRPCNRCLTGAAPFWLSNQHARSLRNLSERFRDDMRACFQSPKCSTRTTKSSWLQNTSQLFRHRCH